MSELAVMPLEDYKKACDSVRAKTGKTELITSEQLSTEIDSIETNQYWHDFWDSFQLKGARTNYASAFGYAAGQVWTKKNWKPKYSIRPELAGNMFQGINWISSGGEAVDLVEYLAELGIELDFSKSTTMNACFRDNKSFTRMGIIDASSSVNVNQLFYQSGGNDFPLRKIDKFKFPKYADLSTAFCQCHNLEEVDFEGVIGGCNCNLAYGKFSAKTVRSAISCLENYAGTANEFNFIFKLNETAWNNVNADTENPPPSGNTWQDYVNNLGWLTA